MDEKVKEQILAIRDTGLTNMFDVNVVQRLAYYMGNIIKYLYRYKDKDGAEDLQKAVVYLEKLREENLPKDDDAPPEVRDE